MRKRTISVLGLLLVGTITDGLTAARAHSFPEAETPAAGQTLTAPPSEIAIKFDAPIEKLFAKLEVLNADGKDEATSAPEISADQLTLSIKVGALKPGEYHVEWAVVCIDTHHTNGSYSFEVGEGGS